MKQIDIAKEFSSTPGARTYEDGPDSGQEFFDKLLLIRFKEAVASNEKLTIILDGTDGYASSFINEAFRRLVLAYSNPDYVWNNLTIISNEIPKYINKIRETIYENKK